MSKLDEIRAAVERAQENSDVITVECAFMERIIAVVEAAKAAMDKSTFDCHADWIIEEGYGDALSLALAALEKP